MPGYWPLAPSSRVSRVSDVTEAGSGPRIRTLSRPAHVWLPMDRTPATTVTIYSSWRGISAAFATPLLLTLVGGLAVANAGFRGIPTTILLVGGVLLAVSLFDLPLHTTFDADGIHRRCLLRRHTLSWADVQLIQRARGSLRSYAQLKGSDHERTPSGGLVAALGSVRRYQLTDRIECRSEYDMLRDVVRRQMDDHDIEVSAVRPSMKSPPTTLYRRGVPNPPPPADAY